MDINSAIVLVLIHIGGCSHFCVRRMHIRHQILVSGYSNLAKSKMVLFFRFTPLFVWIWKLLIRDKLIVHIFVLTLSFATQLLGHAQIILGYLYLLNLAENICFNMHCIFFTLFLIKFHISFSFSIMLWFTKFSTTRSSWAVKFFAGAGLMVELEFITFIVFVTVTAVVD